MLQNRIDTSGKGNYKVGLNTKPYPLQMENVDLPKVLCTRLVNILSKVQNDPWSLLIFQTLLWSFRRWSIHHLTSPEVNGFMKDYVWDTMIDLVNGFAPGGLKDFAVVWLSPTSIGDRIDLLEELNEYFVWMVDQMDISIETESAEMQNSLSVFLDNTINEIIERWLNGRDHFRIYPREEEDTENFPSGKIFDLMRQILEQAPPVERPPETGPEAQPETGPEAQAETGPIRHTITSALHVRRTMRIKGKRSYEKVRDRTSKTRKRLLNR